MSCVADATASAANATEEAAKDAFFKKVWDDLSTFREEYKVWQTYGFLPRPKPTK